MSHIVCFDTWSRVVNGKKRSSMLDHIYVKDCSTVKNLSFKVPTFVDHIFIIMEVELKVIITRKSCIMRKWSSYSKENLNKSLQREIRKSNTELCNVQEHWNVLENIKY